MVVLLSSPVTRSVSGLSPCEDLVGPDGRMTQRGPSGLSTKLKE